MTTEPENEAPTPAPMSEFESRALGLLESIDKRLKSIDATAEWFYERRRAVERAEAAMRNMRP